MVTIGEAGMVTHRSFCRFCEATCGILVDVVGDAVVRVRGDSEHPLSRGYTCSKGRNLPAWHHHPKRLDNPLMRDADGTPTSSDWDVVLDDLAARIRTAVGESGPDSVGILLATGSAFDANARRIAEKLWQQLGSRSKYTSGSVDTPCKPLIARLMSGFPGLVPALDESRATLTMFIGCNPVVSHGHLNAISDPVVRLRGLATTPKELWVIDPRVTETSRLASNHIAPRPGTDHVLLAHLVRELLIDGADRAYLDAHTTAADVAQLTATVEPWGLHRTAEHCDVPAQALNALLSAVRRHGRISAQTGTGTTMSLAANSTEWMCWALHIVTGSFDVPGGMWFNPGYLRQLNTRALGSAGSEPAPGPRSRPELMDWLGERPCSALADEIEAGNLRVLIVLGGNPMRALPEPDRLRVALRRLDALAVIDVVATDTTELATHVLPTAGQLERADLPHLIDQFVITLSTQYTPRVVKPAARRRPGWWILAALADRLGLQVLPNGFETARCTDDDLLRVIGERGRGSYDELVENRVAVDEPVYGWVLDGVLPGGRWMLAPALLVEQFANLTNAGDGAATGAFHLVPRRQGRHLNSQLVDGAVLARSDDPDIIVSRADASRLGIRAGSMVRVSGRHGSVAGIAQVSDDIRAGVVSIPHGYGAPNVSCLTSASDDVDLLTGMVRQSGLPVVLEAAAVSDG